MISSKLLVFAVCTIVINSSMAKNYYIQTDAKVNWYDAFQRCAAAGRQLATVNSASEESDLEAAIRTSSVPREYIWLSGTKLVNPPSGVYSWMSTGQPFTYTNWEVNQPDNWGGNEACMHIWPTTTNGRAYAWTDLNCYTLLYYACEDKICNTNGNGNTNGDCNQQNGGVVTNLLKGVL